MVHLVNLSFNQEHLMFLGGKCIHHRDNLLCNNSNLTFCNAKILYSKDNPMVLLRFNLVFGDNLVHHNHQANLFHKGNPVDLSSQFNLLNLFNSWFNLFNLLNIRFNLFNLLRRDNLLNLKALLTLLKVNFRKYIVRPKVSLITLKVNPR